MSHPSNNPPHRIILVAPNHPSNKSTSKNIRTGYKKAYLVNIRAWLMYLYMRNGKHKIRVLPQHTSYVHRATVRAMCWISTNNSCYGSTSVLRWHISFNSVVVAIHLLLHDRAGTLASLLYKAEKPSVRPSVGTFFVTHVAPWFRLGSTPDLLEMKRPYS